MFNSRILLKIFAQIEIRLGNSRRTFKINLFYTQEKIRISSEIFTFVWKSNNLENSLSFEIGRNYHLYRKKNVRILFYIFFLLRTLKYPFFLFINEKTFELLALEFCIQFPCQRRGIVKVAHYSFQIIQHIL